MCNMAKKKKTDIRTHIKGVQKFQTAHTTSLYIPVMVT